MPICEKDRSFVERYNAKAGDEQTRFLRANLTEILDPENQETVKRKWEYVNSFKFKAVGRIVYRKKEFFYWQVWHEIIKKAKDIYDGSRMVKSDRGETLEEKQFKKTIEDLATKREMAEEEVEISEIWAGHETKWRDKGQEDGKKTRAGALNELERKKLDIFQRYERKKKTINKIQDPDEKERQFCELEDWKETELQKIDKEEGKYKG